MKKYAYQFRRTLLVGKQYTRFEGHAFFRDKRTLKNAAAQLRKVFNIPARSIILRNGRNERYLLMLSVEYSKPDNLQYSLNEMLRVAPGYILK